MASSDGSETRDATLVVWRSSLEGRDYLVLHRRDASGSGDGAWTVPTGTCEPDERLADGATRALWEQTGLVLALTPVEGAAEVPVFAARADADAVVVPDDHHDDHAWVPVHEAIDRCAGDEAGAIRAVEVSLTEG